MKKLYLDILSLIMLILTMSFHFLPKVLHEILGLAMAAVIVVHFIWNIKAFKGLLKRDRISLIIDVALLISLVVIIFSGICISNHLFNGMIDMKLQRNITIHQLHVSMPFLMLILSGLHIGLHWQGIRQRLIKLLRLETSSRIYKIASWLLIVILIIAGIIGSYLNHVGGRLMMEHLFGVPAVEEPFLIFALMILGIISIYALIGILIDKVRR